MCSGLKEMWSELRGQTILLSGFLCAFQILTFIYWVQDKYMTVTALLHCIASMLIIIGTLTIFLLYLPHMISHLESTAKPRKTAAIMILIGGILHFIGSILAILNPIYCNYYLCEVHLFVFMILPFTITIILFLDEFYLIFYSKIRFRIVIYSFILFLSGILFIPYYATTQRNDGDNINELMAILYQIIWIIIIINCCFLMICIGCKHKKTKIGDEIKQRQSTWDSPITLSSKNNSFSPSNPYNDHDNIITNDDGDCCKMHETKRKTLILINCLLLILCGSATLITIYFYKNDKKYDIILCFYCLVVIMSWFIGIDSIKYYQDIEYEPIHNPQQMTVRNNKRQSTSNHNNPFNRNPYHGDNGLVDDEEEEHINAYQHSDDDDDNDDDGYNANNNNQINNNQKYHHQRNHRMIIEHNDLDYNNNHNAWTIPPTQNNDDEHNHNAYD